MRRGADAAAPASANASSSGRLRRLGRLVDGNVLRLNLLSGFELSRDGCAVDLPRSAQRVLAFLALHERPVSRLFVASSLWLDSPEERVQASLRTALWRLRRSGWDSVDANGVRLALAAEVVVDVHELTAQARQILRHEASDGGEVMALASAGELLPDWYDEWVLVERERFHQLRLHALEALSDDYATCGRFADAAEVALAAVATEPLRESAHRVLIRAYLAEGNFGAAIRQYETFHHRLRVKLGLAPSVLMEELVRDVRSRTRQT